MMREIPVTSREQWLSLRRGNVGASEVAALFDCSPYTSRYALWQIKAGAIPGPDLNGERPKWGLRLEDAIMAAFVEETGCAYAYRRAGYVQHPTVEGLGCSPDFFLVDRDAVPIEIAETKNVDWLQHKRQWGGEPPAHILLQTQAQLSCTGLAAVTVPALVGGNELKHYRFERRPKIIAEIERRVAEFWQSIRDGRAPEPDGSDSTAQAIKALYPGDDGDDEPVDLRSDNELPELCAAYQEAAALRKQYADAEQEARNGILAKVGEHRAAFVNGFTVRRAVTPAKPDRPANVGEIIKGRAAAVRLTVKEYQG